MLFLMFKSYELGSTFKTPIGFLVCGTLRSFVSHSTYLSRIFHIITWISTSSNQSQLIFRSLVLFSPDSSVLLRFHVFHFYFFLFVLPSCVTGSDTVTAGSHLHICTGDCAKTHHVPAEIKQ